MKRGTVCTVVLSNDYGKPRPAVVVQSDLFADHTSITVLPITTDLERAPHLRIRIEPTPENGLQHTSDVMIDKIQSLPPRRVGKVIGAMEASMMDKLTEALALFLAMDQIDSKTP